MFSICSPGMPVVVAWHGMVRTQQQQQACISAETGSLGASWSGVAQPCWLM